jgi:hypothetical protein
MKKTPEQVMAELESLGVNLGSWGSTEGGTTALPTVNRQRDALLKLRVALEKVVTKDVATLEQLQEQLKRLEHGGGA